MINPLPRTVNITLLIALAIFISASAIITISGFYIYQYQKKEIGRAASQQLAAIAELKVWEISNWRNERIGDANVIYKDDSFAEDVAKYFNNPQSPELKENVLSLLAATQNSYQYQNILLIDKNKTVRLATQKYDSDFGVNHSNVINKAFEIKDIIISDIHGDEKNNTHISVVIPLVMFKKSGPIPLGTVIILVDPQHRLYPTIKQWPLPSKTGEALLVHRDGNDVVYLNELRHIKNTPLRLRHPITETSLPAVKAVLGLKGTLEGIDYRKKKVFAAVKAVPDTSWFLIVKIDQEEIFASMTMRFWLTVFFILVSISIMGILVAYIWRYQQAKYYREKYELEDKRASLYARSLIEASLDPLVTISPEGKIMDVNESTEFVTGRSRKELIGSNFSNYFTEPEKADEGYKLVFEKGIVRDYPLSIRNSSGQVIDVLYNSSLYKNDAGEVQGIFAAARDITALRRAEKELKAAHDELELRVEERTDELKRANNALELEIHERKEVEKLIALRTKLLELTNKELESFSYSVSHDLRAPLRAIDGYSRMILRDQKDYLNDDARRKFDLIRSNTQMMGKLIDDLLAFSRLGRLEINMTRLDMEGLVNDVWMELQIINPDRRIDFKIDTVPASKGDRTLIKQVYSNLLSNAVKYTKNKDKARIETGGYKEENENIYYVKDNGVGFDMDYYDKLFGVFQRLHSTDEYEGTGVGLAIVQRIIHRHGGRVWAEGQVEEGAAFYFTLPIKD
ncbi:MAG: ATP-binding protein [Smithella sp.]|jgi:PAS domain S-box-containing protein